MKIIACVLFAAGLGLTGCALDPQHQPQPQPDDTESTESATAQEVSTGVRCSDKTWRVNFYSDATYTTQVGTMSCVCFQLETLTGVTSNFSKLAFERVCDLN